MLVLNIFVLFLNFYFVISVNLNFSLSSISEHVSVPISALCTVTDFSHINTIKYDIDFKLNSTSGGVSIIGQDFTLATYFVENSTNSSVFKNSKLKDFDLTQTNKSVLPEFGLNLLPRTTVYSGNYFCQLKVVTIIFENNKNWYNVTFYKSNKLFLQLKNNCYYYDLTKITLLFCILNTVIIFYNKNV